MKAQISFFAKKQIGFSLIRDCPFLWKLKCECFSTQAWLLLGLYKACIVSVALFLETTMLRKRGKKCATLVFNAFANEWCPCHIYEALCMSRRMRLTLSFFFFFFRCVTFFTILLLTKIIIKKCYLLNEER